MNSEKAIQAHVESFVRDLTAMIRESALDTVRAALGETVTKKRGPGRPRTKRKAKGTTRNATTTTRPRKGKRIRRSSEDVEALASAVLAHVKANPGQGVTEIARALRRTSKDLKLPIQKLLADKKLKTKGERRGTKYFAGGRGGVTRKKKATKKKRAAKKTRRKTAKKKAARKAKGRKKKARRKTAKKAAA